MTSPYARPDQTPLEELERQLAAIEDELLTLRARTGKVDPGTSAKIRSGTVGVESQQQRQRIALLEGENQLLRQRIGAAREQLERLRTRLRFIEDRGAGDAA